MVNLISLIIISLYVLFFLGVVVYELKLSTPECNEDLYKYLQGLKEIQQNIKNLLRQI